LQEYVSTEISVLESGSIIQTNNGEDALAILIRYE
ncbi:EDD domain protein, partial [Streptococcus suis]